MVQRLTIDDLSKLDISISGKLMDNGETRVRLAHAGADVTMTILPPGVETAWQESHYHEGLYEQYFVAEGTILLAHVIPGSERAIRPYYQNESFLISPGCRHTLRLYPDTVLLTTKYGTPIGNPDRKGNDWYPAEEDFVGWIRGIPNIE